jgi:hypothetical protein
MIRWVLVVAWLASTLPVVGMIGLLSQSNARKAAFCAAARGKAEGRVVRIERENGSRVRLVPILAFTAAGGRAVEFKSRNHDLLAYPPYVYAVDQKWPVVYVPAEPERAEIDEPSLRRPDGEELRKAGLIWCGVMTALFSLLGVWLGRRRIPATP